MNIILLSGGSGTRLWPLSNAVRSKQFLKIFKTETGSESMAQRIYRMIRSVDADAGITIATSQDQVAQIKTQLGEKVSLSVEPCRRDTFPAIVLACAFLAQNGLAGEEPVVVCPIDPLVDEGYFRCLKTMSDAAADGETNITLMGIQPDCPSEKYGYILTDGDRVSGFREKPDENTAKEYIRTGALWNGGVFAFRLDYVLGIAREMFGTSDYQELLQKYDTLEKISFDYAVVEKESRIGLVKYCGQWRDLGTWNDLTQVMADPVRGNAVLAESDNTHVINELNIPLLVLGVHDAVVAATPDGILVADKEVSAKLKNYVSSPKRAMYERRQWGEYKVLDCSIQSDGNSSLTKHLILTEGQHISYQIHSHRTEMWTVTDGEGLLILDGKKRGMVRGDSVTINAGMKHGIKAIKELHIIEVQIGDELTEEDIVRLDYDWTNCE